MNIEIFKNGRANREQKIFFIRTEDLVYITIVDDNHTAVVGLSKFEWDELETHGSFKNGDLTYEELERMPVEVKKLISEPLMEL